MSETAEGISSRKWSYQVVENHQVGRRHVHVLSQGALELAVLTPHGEQVRHLLVTAPQLWAAANEVCLAGQRISAGVSQPSEDPLTQEQRDKLADRLAEAMVALAEMVAKAAGRQDWKDVLQA